MSTLEKAMVLALANTSTTSKSQALVEIGIPRRTYYNWVRQEKGGGKKPVNRRPWNKLREEEEQTVMELAQASPELNSRQLSLKLVGDYGCWISESTVYRILKREGLVKRAEVKNVLLPEVMQRAMAKQAEAERERRAIFADDAHLLSNNHRQLHHVGCLLL